MSKPKAIFVLGGPGSGKGTQCRIAANEMNLYHISAGECLREAQKDPKCPHAKTITETIDQGTKIFNFAQSAGRIVPVHITIELLSNKIYSKDPQGTFLIDGFPRNHENLMGWNNSVAHNLTFCGCIFIHVPENILYQRISIRSQLSGRPDDNPVILGERITVYHTETEPIIDMFRSQNKLVTIDGTPSIEDVAESFKSAISQLIV